MQSHEDNCKINSTFILTRVVKQLDKLIKLIASFVIDSW